MRKIGLIIALAAIFITGCSGPSKKENAELKKIEQEIKTTDSIATEIEKTTDEIQESGTQLDSLLNEL
jgi:PBP1b-binding outer membrane lipoprotein LpoB